MHRFLVPPLLVLATAAASAGADAAGRPKAAPSQAAATATGYGERDDVRSFAADLAQRQQWPLDWVTLQLGRARLVPAAQRLMMPPPAGTAKNWAAYRERFVEPQRIAAGARFWNSHAEWLERAEARFGVPPQIVVGIVGVETFYGRILGDFRVLDVLATLAFDFPSGRRDRSPFFREELEAFLLMCRREGLDTTAPRGSYAGAMGLPQFMPSSINRFAVDFDGDGRIDLTNSPADTIGSVANFLAAHGWQRDMPVVYGIAPPTDASARARLLVPDIVPSFSAADLGEAGAELDAAGRAHAGLMALVELQNGSAAPSFVAGTQNFYTLTRYNWSSYYAMAVLALGDAVRKQR